MTREVKFRAWDNINHVMKYWDYIQRQFDFSCFEESDRFSMMQYTGIKDKNGKEIYEGDIVTYFIPNNFDTRRTSEVRYDVDSKIHPFHFTGTSFEVIGNKYEIIHKDLTTNTQ